MVTPVAIHGGQRQDGLPMDVHSGAVCAHLVTYHGTKYLEIVPCVLSGTIYSLLQPSARDFHAAHHRLTDAHFFLPPEKVRTVGVAL